MDRTNLARLTPDRQATTILLQPATIGQNHTPEASYHWREPYASYVSFTIVQNHTLATSYNWTEPYYLPLPLDRTTLQLPVPSTIGQNHTPATGTKYHWTEPHSSYRYQVPLERTTLQPPATIIQNHSRATRYHWTEPYSSYQVP
jgi:hypothetical protein